MCGWVDDVVQYSAPDSSDGVNPYSLNEARENFHMFRASSQAALTRVRPPQEDEAPLPRKKKSRKR